MKYLKEYKNFINESLYTVLETPIPVRDERYDFLMDICKKSGYEQTNHFFVKELIEIGTTKNGHKLFLNYLDKNHYENRLAYWVIYNEHPDNLYETSWDSGVIWEEDGVLNQTKEKDTFQLYPNFIDIIYKEIKSYTDLNQWMKHLKEVGEKHRYYLRHALQDKKPELTWEEKIDRIKNNIESDRLLNRHKTPYDTIILKEMEELGEDEYNKIADERNKIAMDIFNDIDFDK